MIFVPNVRAQSSSREWLQGKQSDLAGASLLWWPRPCFLASSPKEELEIIKAMTVLHKPVTAHRGRERGMPYGWLLISQALCRGRA